MELVFRLTALCLLTAVLVLLLKKNSAEISFLLTVSAVLLGALLLLSVFDEVSAFGTELLDMAKLDPALFAPLLKVLGIALLVRISSSLCADVGQSALSALLEIAGAVCAFWCAMPLLRAVVDMLEGWL